MPLFNATKTSCCTFGKCSLQGPSWHINDTELSMNENVDYHSATLSINGHVHLQKAMVQLIMLYDAQSLVINKAVVKDMDKPMQSLFA